MKEKEVILLAATQLGIADKIQAYYNGSSTEGEKDAELLLTCFNLVESELALDYFPLYAEEELNTFSGRINYSLLAHAVVRIIRVADTEGNTVDYTLFPDCLKGPVGTLKIYYTYTPKKKTVDKESDFETRVTDRLLSYGIAAEYATAKGLYEEAAIWDKKYKDAIEVAYRTMPGVRMKARRWV